MSQLVSEPYEYNTTLTAIFLKTYGEDTLQCPYKDYSSLDRWHATRDLLSVIFFRCGLKVQICPDSSICPELTPPPTFSDLNS
jgi:hypothetical protein